MLFVASPKNDRFWELTRRRYRLPAVPEILGEAIDGIARHRERKDPVIRKRAAGGPDWSRALWIEGRLSDSRARSLLASSDGARLWVIEDFRKLALSNRLLRLVEGAGIRLCALNPIRASVRRTAVLKSRR